MNARAQKASDNMNPIVNSFNSSDMTLSLSCSVDGSVQNNPSHQHDHNDNNPSDHHHHDHDNLEWL